LQKQPPTTPPDKTAREHILEQRIADLERKNARLMQQSDNPDQAAKAKQEFLANMSHELRTPLNGLLGMAEVLRDTPLNREQHEYVDALRQCGHDLLRIVNNLLDLSSAEQGRLKLRPRMFALKPTLESVLKPKREQAQAKGVAFTLNLDPTLPANLWGDPARLQQVVLNLVGNAVKFTPQGSVTITVSAWENSRHTSENAASSGAIAGEQACNVNMLHVTVADTGIGIPEEKQSDIFEAFHLSEALLTKKYAGAGLGLPISRHLARMMGGELWFESSPGLGSAFHFTALFETPFAAKAQPQTEKERSRKAENLEILLVEDEEVSRFLARVMLTRMGHSVTCAENGRQALEFLCHTTCDLVLMDIQMPELDGISATKAIRDPESGATNPDVPIVALTVFAMQGDRERFLQAGMDEYITKPVDKERLLRAMTRALNKHNEVEA